MTTASRRAPSITLVRHGESTWNELGLVQGHRDESRLTALGRSQARDAAESLREQGFDALISSDLARASETATLMGERLGLIPTLEPLLRERCFGDVEGGPLAALTTAFKGHDHDVIVNPDARPPGGESFRDVVDRAGLFVDRTTSDRPGRRLLVVTHGGMIHALRALPFREHLEGVTWYSVANCSVWQLDVAENE